MVTKVDCNRYQCNGIPLHDSPWGERILLFVWRIMASFVTSSNFRTITKECLPRTTLTQNIIQFVKTSLHLADYHAYQSLACETAIKTDFSELFSLKRIYVKYKNAILSLIDSFFFAYERIRHMVRNFPRYLITTAKHAVKIEPIKYLGKYKTICLILPCAEKAIYMWQNSIFIFYINTCQRK